MLNRSTGAPASLLWQLAGPVTVVDMVGAAGIEPTTPCSQSRCASAAPRPDDLILYARGVCVSPGLTWQVARNRPLSSGDGTNHKLTAGHSVLSCPFSRTWHSQVIEKVWIHEGGRKSHESIQPDYSEHDPNFGAELGNRPMSRIPRHRRPCRPHPHQCSKC